MNRFAKCLSTAFFATLSLGYPAHADQAKHRLEAAIKEAATNVHSTAEHTVDVANCMMTTQVLKLYEELGMKLWSSFVFDMRMTSWSGKPNENFLIAIDDRIKGQEKDGFVLIMFEMKKGTVSRHEVPEFRVHTKKEHRPSNRQGHVPYFYRDSTSFFISHQGEGVVDKAIRFTTLYDQYVAEYCLVLG